MGAVATRDLTRPCTCCRAAACRHVGPLEVCQARLAAALAPSPARCTAQLHALLPALAADARGAFVAELRELVARASAAPASAEAFVAHGELVREIEGRRAELGRRQEHVRGRGARAAGVG